jgi:hypothetical protein
MKAKGLLITTDGNATDIEFDKKFVSLEELQKCVEGYIEILWLRGGKALIVNEEGKLDGLPINDRATYIIGEHGINDTIVGNALLIETKYID